MLDRDATAPDFRLPGVDDGSFRMFDLHRPIEAGEAVVLLWSPAAFIEEPTAVYKAISRAGWHDRVGLAVWGLCGDSIFALHRYAETTEIALPLVSDFHASVADRYKMAYEDWEAHGPTPGFGWVVIDDDWHVASGWLADETADWAAVPLERVTDAVETATGLSLPTPTLEGS